MINDYLETVSLLGRVHRQFLELVKLELNRLGIRDINNVQAMMLFNIGDATMSVGELTLRGCFLGSKRLLQPEEDGRERVCAAAALRA
jgi:hypothetical protein